MPHPNASPWEDDAWNTAGDGESLEEPEREHYSETRRDPEPLEDMPLTEEEKVADMLSALPVGAQVAVYRTSPTWATGHLQTLHVQQGEPLDLKQLDDLASYWGGGQYRFRPMVSGKFMRGGRTLTIDGPTLYQGRPHHADPKRPERPAVIDTTATTYPAQQAPGAPYIIRDGSGQMMGNVVDRLLSRLESIENRLAAPTAAVDPMGQVQGALQLLTAIRQFDMAGNQDVDDDDEDDEDEPEATGPEAMMERLASKWLENGGDAQLFGDGPQATPQQGPPTAQAPGPRLIRRAEQTTPSIPAAPPGFPQPQATAPPPPQPAQQMPPPYAMNPAEMMAMFAQLDPAHQAQIFKTVGDSMGPDATRELSRLMQS